MTMDRDVLVEVWKGKSDEELAAAAEELDDYEDEARQVIAEEAERRSIPLHDWEVRQALRGRISVEVEQDLACKPEGPSIEDLESRLVRRDSGALSSIWRQLGGGRRDWWEVDLLRGHIRYPNACVACLRADPELFVTYTGEREKENYLFARTRESVEVGIPYCSTCASLPLRRRRRARAVAVILAAAGLVCSFFLGNGTVIIGFVGAGFAGWLLSAGGDAAEIDNTGERKIRFRFRSEQYATVFEHANAHLLDPDAPE